jgi:hypothetical protein
MSLLFLSHKERAFFRLPDYLPLLTNAHCISRTLTILEET